MNIRFRMQMKAMRQRQKPPIMASIRNDSGKYDYVVFIHPDHWDEAREQYGDKLIEFWGGKIHGQKQ